jgi:hypothetical protein
MPEKVSVRQLSVGFVFSNREKEEAVTKLPSNRSGSDEATDTVSPRGGTRGHHLVDPPSIAQYAILESMTIGNRFYPAHQYAVCREHGKARGLSAEGCWVCNIPYLCCRRGRLRRLARGGGYHPKT